MMCQTIKSLKHFSFSFTLLPIRFVQFHMVLPCLIRRARLSDYQCFHSKSIHGHAHNKLDEMSQRHYPKSNYDGLELLYDINGRDVVTWTAAISDLIKNHQEEKAVQSFKLMLFHGIQPNYVTILTVIRTISMLNSIDLTREIHGMVIKMGFEFNILIATSLIGLYSLYNISSSRKIFLTFPDKDLVLWTAMISACLKNKEFVESIQIFQRMLISGMEPNNVSILSVLPACADLCTLSLGKQLHGFSIRKELYSSTSIQNSFIDMYSKCSNLESAILVFEGIEKKDLISWNTIICGLCENGYPNISLNMLSRMRNSHVLPDETTIRNVLNACSHTNEVGCGKKVHCYAVKSGMLNFISVGTSLLRMYAHFGDVVSCQMIFDLLHNKDLIAWSAMISACTQAGKPSRAMEIFRQMQVANEKPNEVTLVSLIHSCASMGGQNHGRSIHGYLLRCGYLSNVFIASSLIDFYCKAGRLTYGIYLFNQLTHKDLICWSSMINGYGINGYGHEAIQTVHDMLQTGLKPNSVMLVSILSACSHCGLVDEAWKWFTCMENNYRIIPKLEHYSCMVDVLCRAGQIDNAILFVNKMPMEPDATIWGAILAGCREEGGHVDIAERAANQLFKLNPETSSYHVMLSNMYAECGQWHDVERLRKFVRKKGLKKTAGFSLVHVK